MAKKYVLQTIELKSGRVLNNPMDLWYRINEEEVEIWDNVLKKKRIIPHDLIPETYSLHIIPKNFDQEARIYEEISEFPKHRVIWVNDKTKIEDLKLAVAPQNKMNYGRFTYHAREYTKGESAHKKWYNVKGQKIDGVTLTFDFKN